MNYDKIKQAEQIQRTERSRVKFWESKIDSLEKENKKLRDIIGTFIEYFEEIEKGNYSKTRPYIRAFEKVILDVAKKTLSKLDNHKG